MIMYKSIYIKIIIQLCNLKGIFFKVLFVNLYNKIRKSKLTKSGIFMATAHTNRRKLHKNAMCCFELIVEATLFKTTVVWPLTFHLTTLAIKMNKTCWPLLEK